MQGLLLVASRCLGTVPTRAVVGLLVCRRQRVTPEKI